MKQISGGVTAPKGFVAGGVHCGVKTHNKDKKDLALILSERECTAAAVYTMNRVKAAPIYVTMDHLEDGTAWGIVANSGNANACCPLSHEYAEEMCQYAAQATGRKAADFVVASTGVIGQTLNIAAIQKGMPEVVQALSKEGSDAAAHAIMTTDTEKKETAVTFTLGGKSVTIGAIAKGSGMIHPNMGTMLAFLTTDCAITEEMLAEALHETVPRTFNRVTVDGDTSTNDMCVVLANGMAENDPIQKEGADYYAFAQALYIVCRQLSRAIAADGEGATKLLECTVEGAPDKDLARRVAKSIICSNLVKTAMFGADANWGRVLCAIGYTAGEFDISRVSAAFSSSAGTVEVCQGGAGIPFSEELAKQVLSQPEIQIQVDLGQGAESATAWGCDLSYDYVKINGDYRT